MDSSAAITKRTRSMPPTPASMFLMNLSWPGTSIKPKRMLSDASQCANPRSIEMPRCFSSLRRSVSMPVRARTRAVLPWSMWPAVPAMIFFIPLLLIVHLAGQNQPPAPKADTSDITPTFRTGVADVRVDAQVLQNNKVVEGLNQDDFVVTDQGVEQKINYFGHDAEPVNLLLLLDISGSMTRWIPRISATARESLGYLSPGDKVAIMVFGKRAELHQEFSDNLAESARQIATVVRDHDVGAGTLINLAVIEAARYMQKNAPQQGRRAILILTDNLSISFMTPDTSVIRALDEADTVLNAIVVGRGIRPSSPKAG